MASDYLALIAEATAIIQKSYPGAVVFMAAGTPTSGLAKQASDLTHWTFLGKPADSQNSVQLTYANGSFGTPSVKGLWLGLQYKQLPQGTIDLATAIGIYTKHGFTEGFSSASMGTPSARAPQPMFWFCDGSQTQGVSALTGQFFPDLFPCVAGGVVGLLEA